MKDLKRLAILSGAFALESPAQQLLDRFLIGYPRDGTFRKLAGCQVIACPPAELERQDRQELERRVRDFNLQIEPDLARAVSEVDGVVVVGSQSGAAPQVAWIRSILEKAPAGSACFVYGALAENGPKAQALLDLATQRKVALSSGTWLPGAWHLPPFNLPPQTPLDEALIVVQGKVPLEAALHGLEGILPVIEPRRGGETGIRRIDLWNGPEVWNASRDGYWSWPLLEAALSRSDSPQGDPVKDGRTQDLAGLRLVRGLARSPQGWLLEHADGLRTAILVLNGVVADFNFALRTRSREILSAQIYRPPAPPDHAFSNLAAVLEDFFRSGNPPWPRGRALLVAEVLDRMRSALAGGY
jgi:hypothetical protein